MIRGLKSAHLVDEINLIDSELIFEDLFKLSGEKIKIVIVENPAFEENPDILVVNTETINLRENILKEKIFIDIDGKEPRIDESGRISKMWSEFMQLFRSSDNWSVKVNPEAFESSFNGPAFFGSCLDYPVVYWNSNPDRNCLNSVNLKVFKVEITEDGKTMPMYQFSVPDLKNIVENVEKIWFVKKYGNCGQRVKLTITNADTISVTL